MIFERFLPTKKPEYRLWSSANYFSLLNQIDNETLNQSLTWDLISFFHEYVGMKDKKIYPYGSNGIMNAYHQKTSDVCFKQEETLQERGLDPTRAKLETKTALLLEEWMSNPEITIGQKIIVVSPRGKKEEGYPGLEKKHYVFINVYEKIAENDFQLVQYTSYAPEKDLSNLQNSFLSQFGGTIYQPTSIKLPTVKTSHLSHQIIDRPILLPNTITYEQIEQFIYINEKSWTTTRQQLPKLSEEAFSVELQRTIKMLLEQFWLLTQASPVSAVLSFDQLIVVVREHFLKWVEHHASNYHQEALAPYSLNLDLILENWQLALKKQQNQLDQEEEIKLKKLKQSVKLDPLKPLFRASSVAHCIAGTPGSVALQMMRLNPSAFGLSSGELIKLSKNEKRGLLEKIKSENMTEIKLENGETWMVPASFLPGKGCFVSENGIAMGPCDIPLSESFAFKMTAFEFNLFVQELEKQLFSQDLAETEQEIITKIGNNPEEVNQLKIKIDQIKNLIFKPVVSITELISGDIVKSYHQNLSLATIINQLKTSSNPLQTCEVLIRKILEDQNGVLEFGEV